MRPGKANLRPPWPVLWAFEGQNPEGIDQLYSNERKVKIADMRVGSDSKI